MIGNITEVHDLSTGLDGDIVFAIALDKSYQNLVKITNFNSKMTEDGFIVYINESIIALSIQSPR